MDTQQVSVGCRPGLFLYQEIHEAAGKEPVIDGIEPVGAFGMPLPHLMQSASRLSNI
jgi:hypothetical protein